MMFVKCQHNHRLLWHAIVYCVLFSKWDQHIQELIVFIVFIVLFTSNFTASHSLLFMLLWWLVSLFAFTVISLNSDELFSEFI